MIAPDPFALARAAEAGATLIAAADPLIALNAERVRLKAIVNDLDTPETVADAAMDRIWAIRDEIEASPPVTPAGAAVQIQLLRERMHGFLWCEHDDRIADNLIAGLTRMGGRGMSAPDALVSGGRQDNDDAEILALFREWLSVCRFLGENEGNEDDEDSEEEERWQEACSRQVEIENRIFELRGGAIGLAVKTVVVRRDQREGSELSAEWAESLVADAAALVPEIAELAAPIIRAAASRRLQWAAD